MRLILCWYKLFDAFPKHHVFYMLLEGSDDFRPVIESSVNLLAQEDDAAVFIEQNVDELPAGQQLKRSARLAGHRIDVFVL